MAFDTVGIYEVTNEVVAVNLLKLEVGSVMQAMGYEYLAKFSRDFNSDVIEFVQRLKAIDDFLLERCN